jgi:hypothetical protein
MYSSKTGLGTNYLLKQFALLRASIMSSHVYLFHLSPSTFILHLRLPLHCQPVFLLAASGLIGDGHLDQPGFQIEGDVQIEEDVRAERAQFPKKMD